MDGKNHGSVLRLSKTVNPSCPLSEEEEQV